MNIMNIEKKEGINGKFDKDFNAVFHCKNLLTYRNKNETHRS